MYTIHQIFISFIYVYAHLDCFYLSIKKTLPLLLIYIFYFINTFLYCFIVYYKIIHFKLLFIFLYYQIAKIILLKLLYIFLYYIIIKIFLLKLLFIFFIYLFFIKKKKLEIKIF